MRKRAVARKKIVSSKAKKRVPQYIAFHRIFVYTTAGIFLVTLVYSIAVVSFPQFTTRVNSLNTSVLGEEETFEDKALEQELDKLAEEQKRTEKEISELKGDNVYEKPFVKPTLSPDRIEVKTRIEGKRKEIELETRDGQKIKTHMEKDGTEKIEIEHKKLKIRYEVQNGTIVKKAADERGKEITLDKDEFEGLENELEEELEENGIKIATGGAGKLSFAKNEIAATTHFPLAIDLGTNQLVVNTPAGQKIVAVLPDDAVQNMLATGVIHALDDAPVGTDAGVVEFTVENDEPIYRIAGRKKFKFLGFIPVTQPVTAVVSSETGKELKTETPFLTNLVDLLSP